MARACVLLPHGFEEIEAVTVIDVLRRAGVDVTVVGVEAEVAVGAHSVQVMTDVGIDALKGRWDAVVLPGGVPGATTLRDHPGVQALLRWQADSGGLLAAICAGPIALGKAGVLHGKRATCYPGFEPQMTGAEVVKDRVVEDGEVITSRGPGTALEFSLRLVEVLVNHHAAARLRRAMLVR